MTSRRRRVLHALLACSHDSACSILSFPTYLYLNNIALSISASPLASYLSQVIGWPCGQNISVICCFILRGIFDHTSGMSVILATSFFVGWLTAPALYVTRSGKTSLICTLTEIHFLSVHESCTHALPRNTKYLTTDGYVFYRRLFTDVVES